MSKFRTIVMYFVLLIVTAVLLFGVHRQQVSMDKSIADNRLRFTGEIRNAPPMVIFTTVALGSFRGLVADLLWLRAGALQQEKSYFEMVQLARWITDLQPSFSGATAYLAWNMAYNISVTCSSFPERWRWVNEGIRLIREQAIEYNPDDQLLYKELAWIFLHKLGNILDDANLYYKNQLAIQMSQMVGYSPNWKELASAPKDEKAFLRAYPEDHVLWALLKNAGIENYEKLLAAFKVSTPELPENIVNALGPKNDKLKKDLLLYLRRNMLMSRWKLDAARIVMLNEKYGEMDWRVPESHAIYWATIGIEKAYAVNGDRKKPDVNCTRIITQALYDAFRSGRILMVDEKAFGSIMVVPNLALVDSVFREFTNAQNFYDGPKAYHSTFRSARINFMKEAITILFNYGNFKKAEEYFKKLKQEDGPQKGATLEQFVMEQWAEDVRDATVKKASEIISGLIFRSINYMIYNDEDAALANERIARYIYRSYMLDMGASERTKLPPYNDMKKQVVESCLKVFPPAYAAVLRAKIAAEQAEAASDKKIDAKQPVNIMGGK